MQLFDLADLPPFLLFYKSILKWSACVIVWYLNPCGLQFIAQDSLVLVGNVS